MMTNSQLRDLAVAALKGATSAGQNVFAYRSWPTDNASYPILLVKAPKEHKESLGRNAPQFTVTVTLGIIARVKASALPNDAAALQAEQALETIQRQVEVALINNTDLTKVIQQIASVDSEMEVSSEGNDINGQLVMAFALEFYQGPEDFYPLEGTPVGQMPALSAVAVPLKEINITETNLPPAGIDITLPQ